MTIDVTFSLQQLAYIANIQTNNYRILRSVLTGLILSFISLLSHLEIASE